ncbi:DUF5916 domain-containing protein [Chryseobacterium sp. IHB B 17019]
MMIFLYDMLFSEPTVNNFSIKLTYFLDYNRVKYGTKKKAAKKLIVKF